LENLDEMGKFADIYDLPKLNQEETSNPNMSVTSNEIQTAVRKPSNKEKFRTGCIYY
jgi:hypothetical protein